MYWNLSNEKQKNKDKKDVPESNDLEDTRLPFYYRYPWAILVNPVETRQADPLQINLQEILPSFLVKLRESGYIDLQISGRAIYSASLILRLKTDLIIKLMQAIGQIEEPTPEFQDLPPLQLPLRIQSKHVSLDELLLSLVDVLSAPSKKSKASKIKSKLPELLLNLGMAPERANIDTLISRVYERILALSQETSEIPFENILRNKKRIELVRVFLSILYLLSREQIDIIQTDNEGTLMVKLVSQASTV